MSYILSFTVQNESKELCFISYSYPAAMKIMFDIIHLTFDGFKVPLTRYNQLIMEKQKPSLLQINYS